MAAANWLKAADWEKKSVFWLKDPSRKLTCDCLHFLIILKLALESLKVGCATQTVQSFSTVFCCSISKDATSNKRLPCSCLTANSSEEQCHSMSDCETLVRESLQYICMTTLKVPLHLKIFQFGHRAAWGKTSRDSRLHCLTCNGVLLFYPRQSICSVLPPSECSRWWPQLIAC